MPVLDQGYSERKCQDCYRYLPKFLNLNFLIANNWPEDKQATIASEFENLKTQFGEESIYLGIANIDHQKVSNLGMCSPPSLDNLS